MQKSKLVFLLSCWGDAHQMSRVNGLDTYYDVEILAFERGIESHSNYSFHSLGRLENGKYFNRIVTYWRVFIFLFKTLSKDKKYYVFGFDNLLLFYLVSLLRFRKYFIIYEIPDLRELLFGHKIVNRISRWLDRIIVKLPKITVLTSKGFENYYKKQGISLPGLMIIENKLHLPKRQIVESVPSTSDRIVLGYFGYIRCTRSLDILYELCKDVESIQLHLRGIFMVSNDTLIKKIIDLDNVTYYGTYSSPSDLEMMYDQIDISWVAYPYTKCETGNFQYAMTNRYYEAGFFQKPMIGLVGTEDGRRIEELEVGFNCELGDIEKTISLLKANLTTTEISLWQNNIRKLDPNVFVMSDEYDMLKRKIDGINV